MTPPGLETLLLQNTVVFEWSIATHDGLRRAILCYRSIWTAVSLLSSVTCSLYQLHPSYQLSHQQPLLLTSSRSLMSSWPNLTFPLGLWILSISSVEIPPPTPYVWLELVSQCSQYVIPSDGLPGPTLSPSVSKTSTTPTIFNDEPTVTTLWRQYVKVNVVKSVINVTFQICYYSMTEWLYVYVNMFLERNLIRECHIYNQESLSTTSL